MRTAISESGRAVLEERIQTWITLEEGQLDQVHMIAMQLAISEDEVLDMLNTCANSRAALDRFGIEVYPEPEPSCEKREARTELEGWGHADVAYDLEAMEAWLTRFLIGAAVACGLAAFIYWFL